MSAVQGQRWDDDDADEMDPPDNTAIRELRKANSAKEKRIRELEEQIQTLSASTRQRAIAEALQTRGLNPKVAALVPSTVDPTEEALGAWIDEYSEVFGLPAGGGSASADEPTLAQMRQMDSAFDRSLPGGAQSVASRIAAASTKEELDALIFGGGAGF